MKTFANGIFRIIGVSAILGASFFSQLLHGGCESISRTSQSFNLGYTYRTDSLRWSFAGEDGAPNIFSELSWEKLRINQVTAAFAVTSCKGFYLRGYGDYGHIFHGCNRDSDYLSDDRSDVFSRSINNAGKGEVFDLSAGIGYQWTLLCGRFRVAPLLGASWEEQHLRIYNGRQVIPVKEKIKGLHSSYKTRWYGPWVGGDLAVDIMPCFTVFGSFEYHWTVFRGLGHWNLRTDFLSDFKQRANGHGIVVFWGGNYVFGGGNWSISLIGGYQDWETSAGSHSVTVDDEEDGAVKVRTRLNEVLWRTYSASCLLTYSF